MMNPKWVLLLLAALISTSLTADVPSSTSSYLTATDKARLKKVVEPGFKLQDLSSVHYAVFGFRHIKEPITRLAEVCEFLIKSAGDSSLTTEQLYYLATTWKSLEQCQPKSLPLSALTKSLTAVLEKDAAKIPELYHAVNALVSFGQKIPDAAVAKIVKTLQATLKKDDSPLNLGYVFHIAADLGSAGAFAFNHIEDAIVQADEVDGRFLQFEGGLGVTSLLVNGVFKLSSSLKKKPPLTSQQTVKLANYFLSRRSVQTPKGAVNFLSSINILATNEFEKPICIALSEDGVVVSAKQPLVRVKVCDLLGNPVPSVTNVIANTATKVTDDVVVISKKNFQATPNDKTLFTLNFMSATPEPGFYKIAVSAGSVANTVTIKVLAEVKVDYLEIGTADADQTTQPKLVKVAHPQKLNQKIEADSQQKLVIRFLLKDASKNKPMRVHQAFVRLASVSSEKDKQEIIFVAEPDASHVYKFDMPVGTAAKNFNYQSGDYNVELIVGDAVLSNSFQWTLATVSLKFPEPSASDVVEKSTYRQKPNVYSPKPEIKHMFREPEKRPPAFVSNLFTGLCLSPLLVLFVLWYKLGVNISNFPFTLSAVVFHLGLGSIFVLFGIFWLKLNMFTTLRYLLLLGLVTFLSGNKLLSQIARNRKASR
ncbi:dolichyl-diphosphooligosaccharide--protein glycosyltransferase subunit 2 [Nasonia vitripennis]|uniref:Dolichyl-diphosphooligosaccharide--protein glycosyltransferase subunit 2 n=1 Tax=Nasonia vitripennis TaxID=7425 RepID=A0A7M7G6W1_NASVI|nr:dolichyl-diphosphooligosaccharide--protein glycosyltransferase subunit 2 [Nasonia vitripennis]